MVEFQPFGPKLPHDSEGILEHVRDVREEAERAHGVKRAWGNRTSLQPRLRDSADRRGAFRGDVLPPVLRVRVRPGWDGVRRPADRGDGGGLQLGPSCSCLVGLPPS